MVKNKKKRARYFSAVFAGRPRLLKGSFQPKCRRDRRTPIFLSKRLLPVYVGAQRREFMVKERLINPMKNDLRKPQ